jgi:hypothetical protein
MYLIDDCLINCMPAHNASERTRAMSRAELHTKREQRLDSKAAAAGIKLATYIFQPDRPVGQKQILQTAPASLPGPSF